MTEKRPTTDERDPTPYARRSPMEHERDLAGAADEQADGLLSHLRNGAQADMDGVMCVVSRQACHEAADEIERLRAACRRALTDFEMINTSGAWMGHPFTHQTANLRAALGEE